MRSVPLLLVLSCFLTVSSSAFPIPLAQANEEDLETAAQNTQNAMTGRWIGALDTDGNHIEIAIAFREQEGTPVGSIDVVGIRGIPLEAISFDPPNLNFQFDSPVGLAKFSGEIINSVFSGKIEFPEADGTFSVTHLVPADMGKIISDYMKEQHIPGLAAAVVRDGEVVWMGTYGMASVAKGRPVTPQTIFPLASVTKIITATALLQLHVKGKFKLDEDVNGYLPFTVRNPNFPELPITFAQLLRHRSSIRDNPEFYSSHWSKANGDTETVLGEYLQSYLGLDGALYDQKKNFFHYKPGTDFKYCNTCYALLGYLAEQISGLPYQQYTQEALFKPLGMESAAWTNAGVDKNLAASSYRYDPEQGHQDVGIVGYPDWPAGLLRVNVSDLARFLAAYTQFGLLDSSQLIDPGVIELMAPKHQTLGFYTWFSSSLDLTSDVLYTHGGSDLGARTLMSLNPQSREGFLILTNGEAELQALASQIYQALPTLGWE
jgi:CubicO group peptidase (beta-lactamase class C family)